MKRFLSFIIVSIFMLSVSLSCFACNYPNNPNLPSVLPQSPSQFTNPPINNSLNNPSQSLIPINNSSNNSNIDSIRQFLVDVVNIARQSLNIIENSRTFPIYQNGQVIYVPNPRAVQIAQDALRKAEDNLRNYDSQHNNNEHNNNNSNIHN
jgi:hypothetical protein